MFFTLLFITHKELECNKKMPRILEFSRKISIFIAEKISLCEGEKEKDLARKTVNSNHFLTIS